MAGEMLVPIVQAMTRTLLNCEDDAEGFAMVEVAIREPRVITVTVTLEHEDASVAFKVRYN